MLIGGLMHADLKPICEAAVYSTSAVEQPVISKSHKASWTWYVTPKSNVTTCKVSIGVSVRRVADGKILADNPAIESTIHVNKDLTGKFGAAGSTVVKGATSVTGWLARIGGDVTAIAAAAALFHRLAAAQAETGARRVPGRRRGSGRRRPGGLTTAAPASRFDASGQTYPEMTTTGGQPPESSIHGVITR